MDYVDRQQRKLRDGRQTVSDKTWINGDEGNGKAWYLDDDDDVALSVEEGSIRGLIANTHPERSYRTFGQWDSDSSEADNVAVSEEVDIDQLLAESLDLSPILERADHSSCDRSDAQRQSHKGLDMAELYILDDDVMIHGRYDSQCSTDAQWNFASGGSQRKRFNRSHTLPEITKCELPNSTTHLRSSLRVKALTSSGRSRTKSQNGRSPSPRGSHLCSPVSASHAHDSSRSPQRRGRVGRPPLERRGNAWALDDDDDVIVGPVGSSTSASPLGYASQNSHSPTLTCPPQLYYTTPPRTHMTSLTSASPEARSRLDRAGSAKSGLTKLARRLSQKERRQTCVSAKTDERKKALRQRSVSLDCVEGRRALTGNTHREEVSPQDASLSIPISPSLPTKLGASKSGSSSPNTSITGRLSRKTSGSKGSRKSPLETADGSAPSRDKKKRSAYDSNALFEAVERQDMETARMMLVDSNGLDVNRTNDDDLTVLDVAIMSNHVPMSKMLLSHGARENPEFQKIPESRSLKLITLINQTEKHIADLKHSMLGITMAPGSASTIASGQQKECERQMSQLDFRLKLMRRMKSGYDHAQCPEPPTNVQLSVSSSCSLFVQFNEPNHHNGAVVTRYKVEWSCFEDFSQLAGEQVIDDPRCLQYEIPGLTQGNCYYVRVSAWNVKGFGDACVACPAGATPSSWREVGDVRPRCEGKLDVLDEVLAGIQEMKTSEGVEKSFPHQNGVSPMPPRKSTVRKSIKNLFSSAPKFQKTLKRGVFLACLLCNEDRILVTNEDNLPIIEVDESYNSASLNSDFHWLMKISCNWEDVKSLRREIDKSNSAGMMPFRSKLLQACSQLQSVLGVQDLGQFHHSPVRDSDGSVVMITVNYVRDPKVVTSTHVKWVSLGKVQRKASTAEQESPLAPEALLSAVPEMLSYARLSTFSLSRGLYLGYLKLKSSVDLIRIMAPEALPNVLPHVKIRDCPNVSKEEWQWFRDLTLNETRCPPTPAQSTFQSILNSACSKLLEHLGISEDEGVSHRLYDVEVIELSDDVSILLLLPPVEGVCSVPGHQEDTPAQRALQCLTLPVQVFEMIHMSTYQSEHLNRFCRASCALETDSHLAQQAQREAFSSDEISVAKQRVDRLNALQQTLDDAWKGLRWTRDIIAYARDKALRGGLPLSILLAPPPSPTDSPSISRKENAATSTGDVASSTCSDCGYHSDISSLDSQRDGPADDAAPQEDIWFRASRQPGILRVYAAYVTGLARGTSVKLHVTPKTTSREVVNLVVQQLNKAVLCRGLQAPVYGVDELRDFCLVAVIGARERVLRDEYQPLQLQNPWTKGRLYVRLQANLLAAIDHGHVTTV